MSLTLFAAAAIFAGACGPVKNDTSKKSNDATIVKDQVAATREAAAAGIVKISVSKNGFEPSAIEVEKGKPIKLAFTRLDKENCASEIVFQKLNITRELPVGETIQVDIDPSDSGEIDFACGMGMMKGKILVQ